MSEGYISRDIEAVIREAAQYFPVITVTGPRQSGKTTMVRHLFENLKYYSLEDLDVRGFARQDPVRFLNLNPEGMILDEVQNVPELLSYIQGIVDEHPDRRYVLSGSSNFALLRNVSQSLAGRSGVFELLPMSFAEASGVEYVKDPDALMYNGLYPAICSGRNIPKFMYPAYVKTYLERDVRDIMAVKDLSLFNTFLRLCAGRIGSVFNASELANEIGVSVKTIQSWMSILEASYIIYLMPPFYENSRKRLTKSPKLYFVDTGLACALLDIESPEAIKFDKMRGHLFENLIVSELLKRRFNAGKAPDLYFYRDSNMNEVDILEGDMNAMRAIEVKSAMTYNQSFEKVLLKIDEWISPKITEKAVVYTGNLESADGDVLLLNYLHV